MRNLTGKRRQGCALAFLFCVLLLSGSGCARTQQISYYQLSSLDTARNAAVIDGAGEMVLGIGPIRLPEYLDRPQLVTRLTPNRLQLADSHRWAEPLSENIPRVLGENLSVLLGIDRIRFHPWPVSQATDYQLLVEILHFENESDGTARLVTRWSVKGKDGGTVSPERRSSHRINAISRDQEGLVAALNEALGSFSQEIAAELAPLLGKPSRSGL